MADRELRIHPAAAEEAGRAVAWYAARSPHAAAGFLSELERALARIAESPEQWPNMTGKARRYVLPRFPFSVIYRLTPLDIQVVAIAHHRRRPGYWAPR